MNTLDALSRYFGVPVGDFHNTEHAQRDARQLRALVEHGRNARQAREQAQRLHELLQEDPDGELAVLLRGKGLDAETIAVLAEAVAEQIADDNDTDQES